MGMLWSSWHSRLDILSDPEHQRILDTYASSFGASRNIDHDILAHSLEHLLKLISKAANAPVVVLIDSYDKPLVSLKSDDDSIEAIEAVSLVLVHPFVH